MSLRNVLVTGGSRGIGLAIATTLAKSGYRAIALARRPPENLGALDAECRSAGGGELHFTPFDLEAHMDDAATLVRTLRAMHGPIYGLINNAGIGTSGILSNMKVDDIERLIRFNTLVPIVITKHVVRSMMSAGGGRIVNISSIVASTGYSGLSVYSATKAALIGFTRSLAREVGPIGVTVNAVAPGFIETDLTNGMSDADRATISRRSALKRAVDADDVASAVDFLMSERARNITGTVMTIDAGNTA